MQVSNVDLLKLQTQSMQKDRDVQGFATALNEQIKRLAAEVINVLMYSRVDDLPEEILDILAWQFSVDWYDAESDLETKRQAINDALIVSQTRGTPAAVQKVIEIYFGNGRVEEWFQYGGEPGYFRVVTDNPSATQEKATLLIDAVNSVKNLRSRLESVIIESTENMNMYFGFALHTGDRLTIEQVV